MPQVVASTKAAPPEFVPRKVLGEKNAADLFTKHIESGKKLEQLVNMFNCEFRKGRSAAAPKLKRAAQGAEGGCVTAAVIVAGRLPHLHSDVDIEKEFPAAVPPAERRGEEDVPPEQDLGDPVPRPPGASRPRDGRYVPACDGVRRTHVSLISQPMQPALADIQKSPYGPWGGV